MWEDGVASASYLGTWFDSHEREKADGNETRGQPHRIKQLLLEAGYAPQEEKS